MATDSTSGLIRNEDFSSELLLNRVMDGQLRANSGKKVTAGSRSLAAKLDSAANSYGAYASKVAASQPLLQGAQDAVTEMISQLKYFADTIAGMTVADAKNFWSNNISPNLAKLLATKVSDGSGTDLAVLGGGGRTVALGLGAGESVNICDIDVAGGTKYAALGTAMADSNATLSGIQTACNNAISELYGVVGQYGAQASLLANRYDMLNDLAGTYHEASDDQAVASGGSSSLLLEAVL